MFSSTTQQPAGAAHGARTRSNRSPGTSCAWHVQLGPAPYAAAVESYQRAARVAAQFHEDWDLLLSPTLATTPVPLGSLSLASADPAAAWPAYSRFSPFTAIANLTGQPAITLPIARSGDGLPIGMMFTAGLGREDLLLRLAAQLEAASPWQLPADMA